MEDQSAHWLLGAGGFRPLTAFPVEATHGRLRLVSREHRITVHSLKIYLQVTLGHHIFYTVTFSLKCYLKKIPWLVMVILARATRDLDVWTFELTLAVWRVSP